MLALADRFGYVGASVPGLADASRVTLEECEDALRRFQEPDRYSRSQEHEGRRISTVDRGWQLLNHEKFREARNSDERREQNRLAQQRHRQKVADSHHSKPSSAVVSQNKPIRSSQITSDLPSGEREAPAAPPRPRRRFVTPEEIRSFAPQPPEIEAIRRLGRDSAKLVEAWRNHHLAKGSEIVDLTASLRTWIAREPGFTRESPQKPRQPPGLAEHRRFGGKGDEGASSRPEREEWRPAPGGGGPQVRPQEALSLIGNALEKIGGPRA